MTKLVHLRLSQDHGGSDDAATVAAALKLRSTSPMLDMAASLAHRDTVIDYRDCAVWQSLNCHERDDAHEKDLWYRIALNLSVVLGATRRLYLHRRAHAQAMAARKGR
jgi:hypothetical protein